VLQKKLGILRNVSSLHFFPTVFQPFPNSWNYPRMCPRKLLWKRSVRGTSQKERTISNSRQNDHVCICTKHDLL